MALMDDADVSLDRGTIPAKPSLYLLSQCLDEGRFNRLIDENIVWCNAGLPGVEKFPPNDPLSGTAKVGIRQDKDRALSSQFEGDRGQVFGRSQRHDPSNRGAPCKEDLIKAVLQ